MWFIARKLLSTRVGLTTITLAVAVLVVTWISFSLIQYGADTQQEKIEALRNEQQIKTRERIDRAIRDNSRVTDPDINRDWLRSRNERQ